MTQAYHWDGIIKKPIIAVGASLSESFGVPRNCAAMTIFTPTVFTGTRWKLQSLAPMMAPETEVWHDTYFYDAASGTQVQVTFLFTAQSAVTLSANQFGGGNLRLSSYSDTQLATAQFYVIYSGFQN